MFTFIFNTVIFFGRLDQLSFFPIQGQYSCINQSSKKIHVFQLNAGYVHVSFYVGLLRF